MSINDDDDSLSSSARSSFVGSESDRSIFSRSDSLMESMSISDILIETMMMNKNFLDEEEEKKLDDVSFHLT